MDTAHPPRRLATAFAALAPVLIGLGILQAAWWSIAGGVGALAAAAWLWTEDP